MTVLPRETYAGPVLAGSRWRQRGLNGHSQYLVTVLRHAGRSVQLVIEGTPGGAPRASKSRRDVGKKYNVPIDQFRNSYVLVAQPKGYVEPTPLQTALDRALAEVEVAKQPTAWPTPPPAPGAVTPATVLLIDGPPTAEEMDENLAVLQQNWKEQEQGWEAAPATDGSSPTASTPSSESARDAGSDPPHSDTTGTGTRPTMNGATLSSSAALATPTPTAAPTPTVSGATPTTPSTARGSASAGPATTRPAVPTGSAMPGDDDPDTAFAIAGRAIINRLAAQIGTLEAERAEYQAIVDDLGTRIGALQERWDRITRAVEVAIETVQEEAPAIPPEPPHRVDRSVARENPAAQESGDSVTAGLSESAESGPTAPPEGREPGGRRLGQREFLVKLLRGLRDTGVTTVTVAHLADAYAREFELPIQRASMNVSSILVDQMKRATTADWPAMRRVEKGIYAFA
jgi:hypothetical protein